MRRQRDGDRDQVDAGVAEQLGGLAVGLADAEAAGRRIGGLPGPARDGREFEAGQGLQGGDVGFPCPAAFRIGADDPDLQQLAHRRSPVTGAA